MVDTKKRPPTIEERKAAIYASDRARKLRIWPVPCPTCLADVGQPCITRTGRRFPGRHKYREEASNEERP